MILEQFLDLHGVKATAVTQFFKMALGQRKNLSNDSAVISFNSQHSCTSLYVAEGNIKAECQQSGAGDELG